MPEDFEEIYVAGSKEEADVIKGLLESEGIPVLFKDSGGFLRAVHPFDSVYEIKIFVPSEKADTAKMILQDFRE